MLPSRHAPALLACISILTIAACGERATDVSAERSSAATESAHADVEGSVSAMSVDQAPPRPAGGSCALDLVDGALAGELSAVVGSVVFQGWVVDAAKSAEGDATLVLVGDERHVATILRDIERPDVAAALGSDAARMSGFNQTIALDNLPIGEYRVHLVSGGVECETGKKVAIGG